MKLFTLTMGAAALTGQAAAFHGSLGDSPYTYDSSGLHQRLFVTDYLTGSEWSARLDGGWDNCAGGQKCWVSLLEDGPDNFNFAVQVWRTDDGCHNIDFEGYLDAHHGYCCGSLPCDISA